MAVSNVISTVLVKIAADASDFNAKVSRVQRSIFRMGRQLSIAGTEMTNVFTIPLLAAGGAAIKFGADLDAMERGLRAVMKTTMPEARKELENLIETAKTPGLGLKQTIDASIGLQAMGFEADQARGIIVSLGRAVDNAGGSAANFERGMLQLRDIFSKNKLEMRDWKILVQAIPSLQIAANKAFNQTGVSLDFIRKNSNGARDAMSKILVEASKLEGTGGSLKNTLDNLRDSFFLLLGTIGKVVAEEFNLQERLDDLIGRVEDIVPEIREWFKENGKLVVGLGKLYALLIVVGPAARVLGSVIIILNTVIGNLIRYGGILFSVFSGLVTVTEKLYTVLGSVKVGFAGIVSGALAAAGAIIALDQAMINAQKRQRAQGLSQEVKALLDSGITEAEVRKRLDELSNFQQVFGDQEFQRSGKSEEFRTLSAVLDELKKRTDDQTDAGEDMNNMFENLEETIRSIIGGLSDMGDTGEKALKKISETVGRQFAGAATASGFGPFGQLFQSAANIARMGEREAVAPLTGIRSGLATGAPGSRIQGAAEGTAVLPDLHRDIDALEVLQSTLQDISGLIDQVGDIWGQAIENRITRMEEAYRRERLLILQSGLSEAQKQKKLLKLEEAFEKKRVKLEKQRLKAAKAQAIFQSIINTAVAVTKVLANPILAAAVAALGAAQTAAIAAQPIPSAAEGKVFSGPTLAMVGDNPNPRIDPEVAAPLSKLKAMFGGQNTSRIVVDDIRVEGTDLVFALREALQREKARGGVGISDVI